MELELEYLKEKDPVNLIGSMTEEEFKKWLKLDPYTNEEKDYDEDTVCDVWMLVSGYEELEKYEKICFEVLKEIRGKK